MKFLFIFIQFIFLLFTQPLPCSMPWKWLILDGEGSLIALMQALANSLDRKYILPAHLRLLLLAFPHFTATESHNQTNATSRTAWEKFAFAERQRARNSLIFRCGCKRLKVKWRIKFATRLIFPRPSHANSVLLLSNLAVRAFIVFTLDFNT